VGVAAPSGGEQTKGWIKVSASLNDFFSLCPDTKDKHNKEDAGMADEIKADYEQLEQVASRFSQQANVVHETHQNIRNSMQNLEDGWIGRGSDAFFAEMQSTILPAIQRLQNALEEASQVTKAIVQTVQQADEEASSPFRTSL